ncbi:hypothetical protein BFJ72_g7556 [Fusarium proliferatum]|uniref:FAD-binding domain-containing protein n=1 Tax=Gibberella intermedia TaxID=948311 RepID=A0A420T989_GIBIN|nr:hypothetical protein BFJ72_g7556 [Fusarium proliferatum]
MAPLKVIIIGGGLAGACLANGLINKSNGKIDVTVYERDPAGSENAGYQIRLGAHALAGFKACLSPDQYAALLPQFGKSGGVVSSAPCIFSPSDLKVMIDLSKAPMYEKSAPISRLRLRNFLQKPLQEHGVIHHGMKYVRYEVLQDNTNERSSIRVHFADGSHQDCDILICADGSGSRANKQIGLDNIVTSVKPGHGGYLSKCNLQWNALQTLPRQLLERGTLCTRNSQVTIFAAVYLPSSTTPGSKTDKWDTTQTLKPKDYDENEASLFFAMDWSNGPEAIELPGIKDKKALMRNKVIESGVHSDIVKLVDAVDEKAIMTTPWRFAKNSTPMDWRKGLLSREENSKNPEIANPRVWLIGDSIHPMLPSRGMGANTAIHDTADALGPLLELANLKTKHGSVRDGQVAQQLALFEKAMMPRAFEWVKKSSYQKMPDLESVAGKVLVLGLRSMFFVIGVFVKCLKLFGWEPKDEAPDLA